MKKSSPRCCYRPVLHSLCVYTVLVICIARAEAATGRPVLLSNSASTRAVALESVTMRPEPFPLTASVKFGPDIRTRITIFAMNLDLLAGESANALSADAEDAAHNRYPLAVEYVGQVPGFEGVYMIIVRLNDNMGDLGDVLIRLNLHGVASNRVRIGVGHVGGGPADDLGAIPTPAPQTPPPPAPAATPNPYTDPAFATASDTVRFLEQSTLGPTPALISHVRSIGYRAFLDEQFGATDSGYPALPLYPVDNNAGCPNDPNNPGARSLCLRDNYSMYPLQVRFYQNALIGQDQLRQRVAFALSQILVTSGRGITQPSWMAPYLQILDREAFSNYRQILYDITLNPAMGRYLDMAGNNKSNPNENYAREILQLFSIGLDQLNPDGTPQLDAQGNRIPTYDQSTAPYCLLTKHPLRI